MSYFPLFLKLEDKKVLIVGGGIVANRKLEKALEFTKSIKIVSLKCIDLVTKNANSFNLVVEEKAYELNDINGFDIVIVATDNIDLQKQIYKDTREKNILFNCSDIEELNDFVFPSYIKEGDLTIAISTNGSSPSFSRKLKAYIKNILPDDVKEFLQEQKYLRKTLPKGKTRMEEFKSRVNEYFKSRFDF